MRPTILKHSERSYQVGLVLAKLSDAPTPLVYSELGTPIGPFAYIRLSFPLAIDCKGLQSVTLSELHAAAMGAPLESETVRTSRQKASPPRRQATRSRKGGLPRTVV